MTAKELLVKVLYKKAKGFTYREKTDEYVVVDGERKLVKSKTVTKHVLPDVSAITALLKLNEQTDVTEMTDEQLQVEKLRLIRLLQDVDNSPVTDGDN